jgi:hypothetical protein
MEMAMIKFGMVALCALVASAPAFAQVTSIETNNPAPKGFGDPNRVICQVEQTTGTRLGARKVCKTRLEWEQMRAEHREEFERFQRQATSTGIPQG